MTIKVTVAHDQPHYNRAIEVQECDRDGSRTAASPVTIFPGAQHQFYVWEGSTLRVREKPLEATTGAHS